MSLRIELIRYPTEEDWALCKRVTLGTIGKRPASPPSADWKHQILEARHSPIRILPFLFYFEDLPYWISVHLCRHVHATPFVQTQRNDRQRAYDRRKATQDAPVMMHWYMNAEELMLIANKRLCRQASPETREVVQAMCILAQEKCPELNGLLVPSCEYHGGVCHEFNGGCGRPHRPAEKKD